MALYDARCALRANKSSETMKSHKSYTTVHPMLMVDIILIIPLLSGPIVAQIEPNIVLALSKTGRVRAAEPATLQN